MRLTERELRELQQQRTARSARGEADCLAEDVLIRAASKELGREERKRVVRHLRTCSDCAREYRVAHSLKPWSEHVAAVSDRMAVSPIELEPWQAAGPQPRIERIAAHPTNKMYSFRQQRFAALFSSVRPSHAIMASFFILSLALGAWVISLRQEREELASRLNEQLAGQASEIASAREALEEARHGLEEKEGRHGQQEAEIAELRQQTDQLSRTITELSAPQINTPIANLVPGDSLRGGRQPRLTTVEVPRGANLFTLILNVTGSQSYSNYSLDIVSKGGKVAWRGQGLRKSPENMFTVTLSRHLLAEGEYILRLYGLRGSERALQEVYAVQVRYR